MNVVNAIAKARFGTAKPQHIQLHKGQDLIVELLCLEAGQDVKISSGEWAYYVVTGKAAVSCNGETTEVPTGQLAATDPDEPHTLANVGEGRLVIIATGRGR